MNIKQITATNSGHEGGYIVFGLGEDNVVYRWMNGRWVKED